MPKNTVEEIRAAVEQRFAKVAQSPDQEKKFPVGPASAKKLGYDPNEIDALPTSVTESFCGVGNPLSLGELRAGQTVLELGSGPGMDSLLAARRVGPTGKVVGVDICDEMICLPVVERIAGAIAVSLLSQMPALRGSLSVNSDFAFGNQQVMQAP